MVFALEGAAVKGKGHFCDVLCWMCGDEMVGGVWLEVVPGLELDLWYREVLSVGLPWMVASWTCFWGGYKYHVVAKGADSIRSL